MRDKPALLPGLLAATMLAASLSACGLHLRGDPPMTDRPVAEIHAAPAPLLHLAHERVASGTAWLPEASPMRGLHGRAGNWEVMGHGQLFLQYISEGSDRGDSHIGSVNWGMLMARRPVGMGALELRLMVSAEPWTLGDCGYPILFATGEFCRDQPIHDRQHPHDLWMEVAALFRRQLASDVGIEAYAAAAGEPALGPVAYPHRPSAWASPLAPIGHHWMDATHIAFGVATLALFGARWKAEASLFNGREPDQNRTDFDFGPLDSYAGRVTWVPTPSWAFQLSAGHLREAELEEIGGERVDVGRITASATWQGRILGGNDISSSAIWGRNIEHGVGTNSFLLETTVGLAGIHNLFWRGELSQKTAHDLVVPEDGHDRHRLMRATVGYLIEPFEWRGLRPGIGGSVSVNRVPEALLPFYGERTPLGWAAFVRIMPGAHGQARAHTEAEHDHHQHHEH